ncbi:DNA polymerase III subunit delta [Scytonema hofmannii PCC 7110]|uniref:DNA polymerase III subunit delta n=1 Tax=Scytonema hofmannii PCC 7110 TaxID=128403 RepID=A0A139WR99_9CYAN|nr:DNA polymerase III subunit delta [Scytonema hofmannii]KYC34927.1 DNA polymerase III subunit delta [Scytonema hofmannii PCC 7110]
MPVYLYWGEDDFLIERAVRKLIEQHIDPEWKCFNYTQLLPNDKETVPLALAEIMTLPFGQGCKIVHLPNSTLLEGCPADVLLQLEQTLQSIPDRNILLITNTSKPDSRNKSVKLLLEHAQVEEYPLIPQWKTTDLQQQVCKFASMLGMEVDKNAIPYLAEAIGNNTRLLWNELEKLKLYTNGTTITLNAVKALVTNNATNSLALAEACRKREIASSLKLLNNLLEQNEPPLKIQATLTTCFDTWLIVKACLVQGLKDDSKIASTAELKNPKRLYYLKQEVAQVSLSNLRNALSTLLELEMALKGGADDTRTLQTHIIKLCKGDEQSTQLIK